MNQREQVIEELEKRKGIATLGMLYQAVDTRAWQAKDTAASIRRIVQDTKYFFKLKTGLYGLNTYRDKLGHLINENQPAEKRDELNHYYYQGLLLEIGNAKKGIKTFAPNQDKNQTFLHTTLGEMRKLQAVYPFSYADTVARACMIDVVWFNRRKMPYAAFEVEHSTDFTSALSKYIALQDFNIEFYVVANQNKRRQFDEKISRDECEPIKDRVQFMNYDKLVQWHGQTMAIAYLGDMP